jgi:HlyD family secretion protein
MVHKDKHSLIKPVGFWSIMLASTGFVATGLVSIYSLSRLHTNTISYPSVPASSPSPTMTAVAALGRLEPQGEVIRLSAANSLAGVRVGQLLVNKGDKVKQGQVIAVLDNYAFNVASVEKAKGQVQAARAILKGVQVGAKVGDIYAQQATIARLEAQLRGEVSAQTAVIARLKAELDNAETENQRYQRLYQDGAIAAANADTKQLRRDTLQQQLHEEQASLHRIVEMLQKQLAEAQAKLKSIAEVRPTDIEAAQADVNTAIASLKQAQAQLDLSFIRSPIDGQVLKIHTRPGEMISTNGIVELGRTHQMYAVAEVYETDIKKVQLGQSATGCR